METIEGGFYDCNAFFFYDIILVRKKKRKKKTSGNLNPHTQNALLQ